MGRVGLGEEEVDDVEEAAQRAVVELLADGDEGHRDARGDADGVLDVEVLHGMSVGQRPGKNGEERTASRPAWLLACGFSPPSSVCRANCWPFRSGRNSVKNVWRGASQQEKAEDEHNATHR